MMRRGKRLALILAAAIGVTAGAVRAQYQVTTDGRMREANNLVGSGGYNGPTARQPDLTPGNFNNAIITGDVTGGRDFRGRVPYTNPTAFRGPVSGIRVDNFIKQSSGAPINGVAQNNAQAVTPYFGPSNAVAPPSGFVQQSASTGGYVPGQVMPRDVGDQRMGQVSSTPTTLLPRPGQLVMPGPVDPNTQTSTVITASPLFGVRQLNPGANVADSAFLQHSLGGALGNVRVDAALAQKIKQELAQSSGPIDQGPIDQQTGDRTTGGRNTGDGRATPNDLNSPLRGGFDAPQNDPLNQSSNLRSNQATPNSAMTSTMATGASIQQRVLGAPKIRSSQLTELEKRLQQYRTVQELSEHATAQQYNQQMRAKREAEADPLAARTRDPAGLPARAGGAAGAGAGGGGPRPDVAPQPPLISGAPAGQAPQPSPGPLAIGPTPSVPGANAPVVDGAPQPPTAPPATPPPPVKIDSLAQGVQGQALSDLLKEAEDLMKKQAYSAAMEKYDIADLVAPNSPLVLLGKANVELGRTYYARAEANLRQAFMQDQALLMGQYNLRSLLGEDRLAIIVRDLRDIAEREATEARPVFLLSYIDYNTANERRAAGYLDLAEKRAGGKDPLYPLIRKYWSLPKDVAPTELNK